MTTRATLGAWAWLACTPPADEASPTPATGAPTTTTSDRTGSSVPQEPSDDFPAQYYRFRATFGWDGARGQVVMPVWYGIDWLPLIGLDLFTQEFVDSGYDYNLREEYCTVSLVLDVGPVVASARATGDPSVYFSAAHSGDPGYGFTTCGDDEHDIGELYGPDPDQTMIEAFSEPWALGVGTLDPGIEADYHLSDDEVYGARIFGAHEFSGVIEDDWFFVNAYGIDPDTYEIAIDGDLLDPLTKDEMWNGVALGTGHYFIISTRVGILDAVY